MPSRRRWRGTGSGGWKTEARTALRIAYARLTAREREVMGLVAAGLLNKQIAAELGVAEATIKLHRGQVMRKMGVRSLADLVRAADQLKGEGQAQGAGLPG